MSANDETIYIKIDQNVLVHDRNVTLSDIASITSSNEAMVRQLDGQKDTEKDFFNIRDYFADPKRLSARRSGKSG